MRPSLSRPAPLVLLLLVGCGAGPRARDATASTAPNPAADDDVKMSSAADASPTRTPGPRSISVGSHHACAIHDGAVHCWGDDTAGEVGARQRGITRPRKVDGIEDAVEVVALQSATCATTSKGELKCWGATVVGDHQPPHPEAARSIVGVSGATSLTGAMNAACVLASPDGGRPIVQCVGVLPPPSAKRADAPKLVAIDAGDPIAVTMSGLETCALQRGGGATCWSHQDLLSAKDEPVLHPTTRSLGPDVLGVVLGAGVDCLEREPGKTVCSKDQDRVQVDAPASSVDGSALSGCAVTSRGLACWGPSSAATLGRPVDLLSPEREPPTLVPGIEGVASVSARFDVACATLLDGRVACFGSSAHGLLGDGSTARVDTPTRVANVPPLKDFVVQDGFGCGLGTTGDVQCWGARYAHGAGVASPTLRSRFLAEPITSDTDVDAIFTGYPFVLVRRSTGAVQYTVGGVSTDPARALVDIPELTGALSIAGGGRDVLALLPGGKLVTYHLPAEEFFEPDRAVPVAPEKRLQRITGISGVKAISSKGDSACAVLESGGVSCFDLPRWTPNAPSTVHVVPVKQAGSDDAIATKDGVVLRCVHHADASLSCVSSGWPKKNRPAAWPSDLKIADVASFSGGNQMDVCVVTTTGEAACSTDLRGLLTKNERVRMTKDGVDAAMYSMPGVTDAVRIEALVDKVCALKKTGELLCIGNNAKDALGAESARPWSVEPVFVALD